MTTSLLRSRIRAVDLLATSTIALRTRRLRTALSALGIAVGICAFVAIVGITDSSSAALIAQIDSLGTDILTASDTSAAAGQASTLPTSAANMISRLPGVNYVSATALLRGVGVYRNDRIPENQTAGLSVIATDPGLPRAIGVRTEQGSFLNSGTAAYPTVVLGSVAASTLGMTSLNADTRVWIGGTWFSVVGIDKPVPLAPALDRAALIGLPVATALFGYQGHATTLYVRTAVERTQQVAPLLPRTGHPQDPSALTVLQPTAALEARAAAVGTSSALLYGLVALTLTIAAIGIANVMTTAVLERRHEIGIRRALGATRHHILLQFLLESVTLALLGAIAGTTLSIGVIAITANLQNWPVVIPSGTIALAFALALASGAGAGFLPAVRAAHQSPIQALRP